MIGYICPRCRATLTVEDQFAGREADCPLCGSPAIIPPPTAVGWAPAAPSAYRPAAAARKPGQIIGTIITSFGLFFILGGFALAGLVFWLIFVEAPRPGLSAMADNAVSAFSGVLCTVVFGLVLMGFGALLRR